MSREGKIGPSGFEPYQSRAANGVSGHVWFRFKSQPAYYRTPNDDEWIGTFLHSCFSAREASLGCDRTAENVLEVTERGFDVVRTEIKNTLYYVGVPHQEMTEFMTIIDMCRDKVVTDKHRDESWEAP